MLNVWNFSLLSRRFLLGEDTSLDINLLPQMFTVLYTEVLWFFVCVYHWLVVLGLKTSDINYIYGFILGFMMNKDVGNFCRTFIAHG